MKFKSLILAQASGSTGGLTYSRNKGGMYIRSRSLVVTPKTPQQVAAQNAIKTLTARWQGLTTLQRTGWKDYAVNVPILNALGESRVIPELSWYIKCNSIRLQAIGASAIVDAAPTTYSLAVLTTPTFTATATAAISLAYTNTDAWAITTGGYLFVQVSRPLSPTIVFPKANFRYTDKVSGLTATPPTSPAAITSPFPFIAGNQIMIRVQASNSDGRISAPLILQKIAV